jgi:ubiquinone/menaquinone biosynthesis C-methylase UbiE
MAKVYGDDIYAFMGLEHAHLGYWPSGSTLGFPEAQEEYLRRLASKLRLRAGDKVLDVGGGQGASAVWIAENFDVHVVMVDVADAMVAVATERVSAAGLEHRVSCVRSDLLDFDPDDQYDAVVSIEAVHHVRDQAAVFSRIDRLLAPGGRFVVSAFVGNPRPRLLAPLYLSLILGEARIPRSSDYPAAIRSAGLDLESLEDFTPFVLPRSGELFRTEPYLSRVKEYHRRHYGRVAEWGIPLLSRWHDRVVHQDGLHLLVYSGVKASQSDGSRS